MSGRVEDKHKEKGRAQFVLSGGLLGQLSSLYVSKGEHDRGTGGGRKEEDAGRRVEI